MPQGGGALSTLVQAVREQERRRDAPFGLAMVFECPCAREDPGKPGRRAICHV
jgi:hypothetical protein